MGKMVRRNGWIFLLALSIWALTGSFDDPGNRYFEIAKNLDIFSRLYKTVNSDYAEEVDPTRLMRIAIDSSLNHLDPYTNFFSESSIEDAKLIQSGQYSGVGVKLSRLDQAIFISDVAKDSPAAEKGIRIGDRLIAVDGQSVSDSTWTLAQVDELLQGEQGSSLNLTLIPVGKQDPIQKTLSRNFVAALQSSVPFYGMINEDVGYILLTVFDGVAGREVEAALKSLKEQHPQMKGVVLDLRSNPGGRVDQALHVVNVFIPQGQQIVEMRGRTSRNSRVFGTNLKAIDTEIPLAILINSTSASASEIVAGAVQDLDRGVIVGQRSFGKGLVQEVRPLSFNTQLKVTIAKYYTPSGRCIQAIDYSHKNEDGSVGHIPDSLMQAFQTQNGRTVYDGGGIKPDLEIPLDPAPPILKKLIQEGYLFDFANQYAASRDSIPAPGDFSFSDNDYQAFAEYLTQKAFSYETESEDRLLALGEKVRKDTDLEGIIVDMKADLQKEKTHDLQRHKARIIQVMEEEIIRRFYFEEGVIKAQFKKNPEVLAAVEVLTDPQAYQKVLQP